MPLRYIESPDRPYDLCLRMQTFRNRAPIEYKMFRALIAMTKRMHNTPEARSNVSQLMRLAHRATHRKLYDLDYFIENMELVFIDDVYQMNREIEMACENSAIKHIQSGYRDYVANETINIEPAVIPDYGRFYSMYKEYGIQQRKKAREEERQKEYQMAMVRKQLEKEREAGTGQRVNRFNGAQSDLAALALKMVAAGC